MRTIVMIMIVFLATISVEPAMAKTIYFNNFNDLQEGLLSLENFKKEWNNPLEYPGVGERVFIVKEGWWNKVLAVFYPAGKVGPVEGGAEWRTYIGSYEEVILSYKVKFLEGFNFVKGGKLPGLCGGRELITGGKVATGTNGWSVRLMWNGGGKAKAYLYYPDNSGQYGYGPTFKKDGEVVYFYPGKWHQIKIRIKMNTIKKPCEVKTKPVEKVVKKAQSHFRVEFEFDRESNEAKGCGNRDGILQCWLDGDLCLNLQNIRYRDIEDLKINFFHFSTFFGGGTSDWAPIKNEVVFFDDFRIEIP